MKILINGIGGRMGVEIKKMALEGYRGSKIAAGVDLNPLSLDNIATYTDIYDVREDFDCIIDFSHHSATKKLLEYAVEKNAPVVLATTGHDDLEKGYIAEAAKKIPLFH